MVCTEVRYEQGRRLGGMRFLEDLARMRFSSKLVDLITLCAISVEYSMLLNGTILSRFKP